MNLSTMIAGTVFVVIAFALTYLAQSSARNFRRRAISQYDSSQKLQIENQELYAKNTAIAERSLAETQKHNEILERLVKAVEALKV